MLLKGKLGKHPNSHNMCTYVSLSLTYGRVQIYQKTWVAYGFEIPSICFSFPWDLENCYKGRHLLMGVCHCLNGSFEPQMYMGISIPSTCETSF